MLRSKDLPNLWMQFLDRPRGPSHSRGIPPIGRGAEKHLSCTLLVDSGHLANSALQLVMMVIHPKMILTSCRNVIHVSKSLTMSHTKIVIVCNTVRLLTYQKKNCKHLAGTGALANLWMMPFFCRSMSLKKVALPQLFLA